MDDLIAPKGSLVLCPKGHVLCELIYDLRGKLANWGTALGNWRQPSPSIGDKPPLKCSVCGSVYYDDEKGPQIYFRPQKKRSINSFLP